MNNCYCGNQKPYSSCCQPFHKGTAAQTPEELMRSRYSAYAVNNVQYIADTNDPEAREIFDFKAAEDWAKKSKWLGLQILSAKNDEVEFKARYVMDGIEKIHHERSLFRKDEASGRWLYQDGHVYQQTEKRVEPKVGRNDPCTCGSGKKFKKCCGQS